MSRFGDLFRRPRRVCQDPVFGRLLYDRHAGWTGEVQFAPTGQSVLVLIDSDGAEPSEADRAAFRELVERYAALRSSIGVALFALLEPCLREGREQDTGRALAITPDRILDYTTLESIHVRGAGQLRLGYGFQPSVGWDDATLSVRVDGRRVTPESLDD
jgi:hypothetical protein